MRIVSSIGVLALGATSLAAQLRTLPTGYQARPGEYLSGQGVLYPFARSVAFDYQEVHRDWNGTTQTPLISIGFRRAPNRVANTTATAHTLDATVTMGPGDFNTFSTTFANNYTAAPTVVIATRPISMPDWTQPLVPREQFSITMMLDAPYVVNTSADFVWQLLVQNSTLPNVGSSLYYADRTGTTSAAAVVVGTGCTATGRTAPMTLPATYANNTTAATMQVTFSGTNFPASVPVIIHLGLTNLNLPIPGLCGNVIASPDIALPAGPTSAAGALASLVIPLPYLTSLRSGLFYTQALAPDVGQPGLPLALSDGREGGIPPGAESKYIYSLTPPSVGSGPFTAGSVITAYQ